jgi:hypothetical protein
MTLVVASVRPVGVLISCASNDIGGFAVTLTPVRRGVGGRRHTTAGPGAGGRCLGLLA